MDCDVQTGYIAGGAVPAPSGDCVMPAGGRRELITPESPLDLNFTNTFTVTAGNAVLLDAYNMVAGFHLYLQRIVRQAWCPTPGHACNPWEHQAAQHPVAGPISYYDYVTLGGDQDKWSLYKAADDSGVSRLQLIIVVPGMYRLELEEPSSQLGNDMEVGYIVFPIGPLVLPPAYLGGLI